MNGRNSTWCTLSASTFIVIWRMKPDHSETLLRRLAVDLKRSHMDVMFSLSVMLLKLFIGFSTTEISDLSILPVYLIGITNFRRSSLVGYWILWFVLHWTLLDNTANYTHHVKSVFTIQSFWRISELSAEWTGRPNNSLKSTMLGEESWKHKDFSSSRTFTMLEPKPMLCNSCTTNSEPPLLWYISAANTKSKVWYLVLQTWLVLDQ